MFAAVSRNIERMFGRPVLANCTDRSDLLKQATYVELAAENAVRYDAGSHRSGVESRSELESPENDSFRFRARREFVETQ
jgi:hypothetical protein